MKKIQFFLIFLLVCSSLQAMMTLTEFKSELNRINRRIKQEKQQKTQEKKELKSDQEKEAANEKEEDKKLTRKKQREKKAAQEWANQLPKYITQINDVGWQTQTKYECLFDENNHANIQFIINQMKFNTVNTIPLKMDMTLQSFSISLNGTFWVTYLRNLAHKKKKKRQTYKYTISFQRPDMFLQLFLAIHEKYEQQKKE